MTLGKAVSLLELLRVNAEAYVEVATIFAGLTTALAAVKDDDDAGRALVRAQIAHFSRLKTCLAQMNLKFTLDAIEGIEKTWEVFPDCELFVQECVGALKSFQAELRTSVFLQVPSAVQSLYENPRAGWEGCNARFDTRYNVDSMSRCFVFGEYTASVFHALLIAETGLIELGHHIGVTDPVRGWDATSKKLAKIVQDGRNAYSSTIPFSEIEQLNQCVQAMKQAWRNKVSHEAGRLIVLVPDFSDQIAHEIIVAVRGFMRRLAEVLSRSHALFDGRGRWRHNAVRKTRRS